MRSRLWRAGRSLTAAAVGVMLVVSAAAAEKDRVPSQRAVSVAAVVKAPVKVLAKVVVTQAKMEHDVSAKILHAGVDLFTRSLHWLARKGESGKGAPPLLRYW